MNWQTYDRCGIWGAGMDEADNGLFKYLSVVRWP